MILAVGVGLGSGLLLVRRALRPVPLATRLGRYGLSGGSGHGSMWTRLVHEVEERCRLAESDLAITNTTSSAQASRRLILGLAAACVPVVTWFVASAGGATLAGPLVALSALVLGICGFQFPVVHLKNAARQARRRFRTSLSAYLDLVSIMLAGGAGIETALHTAARIGDGPTFDAISHALDVARATRKSPWDTLADTGSRMGIDELPELAATVRLGGEQGARMTASLVAKASALRTRELADVEARANEATERMGLPMVLLFIGFLLLLGYPAMHLITSGFEG